MNIRTVLDKMVALRASDLHLKAGTAPVLRVDGVLYALDEEAPSAEDLKDVCNQLLTEEQRAYFSTHNEIDFAFGVAGLARFRANIFLQRGTPALALRHISVQIPSIEELALPEVVRELAFSTRGLILVTGTTGSGKSTTLAAMIDAINRVTARNVITVEDPIEYLHLDRMSCIHQREVGLDTASFKDGLKYVLRQDPDIILIGELRDTETAHTAVQAAESGHLVFSTLHTIDAAESLGRMIEFFPPAKQQQIRSILAGTLRGVVSQRLIPSIAGGRVPAVEVMVTNARIQDLIRENRPDEITDAIDAGEYYEMQSFASSLIELVLDGSIDRGVAANAATNRHDFLVALEAAEKNAASESAAASPSTTRIAAPLLRTADAG